jgi:hypothetical protein
MSSTHLKTGLYGYRYNQRLFRGSTSCAECCETRINPRCGTVNLLNVRGNSLSGFTVEIERNYALAEAPTHQSVLLSEVADEIIIDFDEVGKGEGARTYVEEAVLSVGAPMGSLRNISEGMGEVSVWICEL